MVGIMSSFGFSSKKTPENSPSAAKSSLAHAAANPTSEIVNAVAETADPFYDDRNSNMRLSKSNPPKLTETEFEIPNEPVMSSYSSANLSTKPATAKTLSPGAVIGAKITFKGELSGEEDLLIQGRVEGTVDLKGHQLIVGEHGNVKANLTAKVIIIEGTVEGDLIGQERIEIKASSKVKGNLVADRVILEDGAQFRGSIDMDSKDTSRSSNYSPTSHTHTSSEAKSSSGSKSEKN